jgi:hypothetical protein
MSEDSEAYMAFDTSKLRNAVAIAEAGRSGEVVVAPSLILKKPGER